MPVQPKDDDAFLSRWSRRKREGTDVAETPEPASDSLDDLTDEEALAELELPDPDAMKPDDDFSAFMQARVPERLRRRALRVLWRSNPVLANLDELVDYGEDFTDSATVIENMQTVYEVGKGAAEKWKRHLAALAAEEKAQDHSAEISPIAETANQPEDDEVLHVAVHEPPHEEAPYPGDTDTDQMQPEPTERAIDMVVASPKPMRFSFE